MIRISKYVKEDQILFLNVSTRDKVIQALVKKLNDNHKLDNPIDFYEAIDEREKIVTTGIGMGVAIPHAKLPGYDDFFLAIAILEKGVDWGALDGTPVRLVFLIGGPDDKQTEYLQILSGLTMALKDEERRKKLLTAQNPEAVLKLFKAF